MVDHLTSYVHDQRRHNLVEQYVGKHIAKDEAGASEIPTSSDHVSAVAWR